MRRARQSHRMQDVAEVRFGVHGREALDLGVATERMRDVRPLSRRETQPQSQRLERQQDVGEQNRGVHAEPLHRLKRHLSRQLGRMAQIEDGVLLAQLAVLRHVAPRLPHEPHRGDVGAFPAAGFKKAQLREPRRER
jgi:hypothetical protein